MCDIVNLELILYYPTINIELTQRYFLLGYSFNKLPLLDRQTVSKMSM